MFKESENVSAWFSLSRITVAVFFGLFLVFLLNFVENSFFLGGEASYLRAIGILVNAIGYFASGCVAGFLLRYRGLSYGSVAGLLVWLTNLILGALWFITASGMYPKYVPTIGLLDLMELALGAAFGALGGFVGSRLLSRDKK